MPNAAFPAFGRYVGIDYSGAATPDASLSGLRVYLAQGAAPAEEVLPPQGRRKYWTRRGLAQWLAEFLAEDVPTLVGIDHAFSFPLRYFQLHELSLHWPSFLEDFQRHWPTDEMHTYVDHVREGRAGNGAARTGSSRWRRLCDERAKAKSVFHFDVQGSVAKSTHSGLPWLLYLRRQLGSRVHFWPFDGWNVPARRSVVAEVYPSLWRRCYARANLTPDQYDAYVAATWLQEADRDGRLSAALRPPLPDEQRAVAEIEGWILGLE